MEKGAWVGKGFWNGEGKGVTAALITLKDSFNLASFIYVNLNNLINSSPVPFFLHHVS